MEIELKFLIQPDAVNKFFEALERTDFAVQKQPSQQLRNGYFDTKEQTLRKFDIGLRIRESVAEDGASYAEQTVKLAGQDIGGLHQRPEHNVNLAQPVVMHADLSLFEETIWPSKLDVQKCQSQLVLLFETDFQRQRWQIQMPSGSLIECVLDIGEIRANQQEAMISEVELELISGSKGDLFLFAQTLCQSIPLRLGFQSKAARGYQLIAGKVLRCKELKTLKLKPIVAVESAIVQSLSYALKFVQHHEQVFCNSLSPKALRRVIDGWSMIIHSLELFAGFVKQSQIESFIEDFKGIRGQHKWVDAFYQLAQLQGRKSPYRKDIENSEFLSGLMAQQQLSEQKIMRAASFFSSNLYNQLILRFIKWLTNKSWRSDVALNDLPRLATPLSEVAGDWLDNARKVLQSALRNYQQETEKANLVGLYWPLVESLLTGLIVGSLYGEDWDRFRNGQHDLLIGCEEFLLLTRLESILNDDEIEQEEVVEYIQWVRSKQRSLHVAISASLDNVEQTRVFWQ